MIIIPSKKKILFIGAIILLLRFQTYLRTSFEFEVLMFVLIFELMLHRIPFSLKITKTSELERHLGTYFFYALIPL